MMLKLLQFVFIRNVEGKINRCVELRLPEFKLYIGLCFVCDGDLSFAREHPGLILLVLIIDQVCTPAARHINIVQLGSLQIKPGVDKCAEILELFP